VLLADDLDRLSALAPASAPPRDAAAAAWDAAERADVRAAAAEFDRARGDIQAAETARDSARRDLRPAEARAWAEEASARAAWEAALERRRRVHGDLLPRAEKVEGMVAFAYRNGAASLLELL